MRGIKYIVLHCTATSPKTTIESIKNYWFNVKKWKSAGYHYIIEANGNVEELTPVSEVSNGVRGHNSESVNLSYIGGVDENNNPKDTRTAGQVISTMSLLMRLKEQFPNAEILGHRDFEGVNKACPSFDVKEWLKHVKL